MHVIVLIILIIFLWCVFFLKYLKSLEGFLLIWFMFMVAYVKHWFQWSVKVYDKLPNATCCFKVRFAAFKSCR